MANDLAQLFRKSFVSFEEALAAGTEQYTQAGFLITDDKPQVEFMLDQSTGGFTAYPAVGTAVDQDIESHNLTHSSSPFAKIERLRWVDIKNNPELPMHRARSMANEGMAHIWDRWRAGVAALFATAHPLAGAGVAEVGAGKMYLDTGLVYSGGTQSNLLTQGLSRTALVTVKETLRNWKRVGTGMSLNIGEIPQDLVLICDPRNEDLAHQLLRSGTVDADLQANFLQGWAKPVITPLSDPNDWFVVSKTISPIGMWIREQPSFKMMEDSSRGGLDVVLSAQLQADFVYDIEGAGIVGSNVA